MDRRTLTMRSIIQIQVVCDLWAIVTMIGWQRARLIKLLVVFIATVVNWFLLHRCFLNDCKANLPNEDYQRIAAYFGFVGVTRLGIAKQWQYITEEAGENGQILLNMWRCRALFIIASLAGMLVLLYNYSK